MKSRENKVSSVRALCRHQLRLLQHTRQLGEKSSDLDHPLPPTCSPGLARLMHTRAHTLPTDCPKEHCQIQPFQRCCYILLLVLTVRRIQVQLGQKQRQNKRFQGKCAVPREARHVETTPSFSETAGRQLMASHPIPPPNKTHWPICDHSHLIIQPSFFSALKTAEQEKETM